MIVIQCVRQISFGHQYNLWLPSFLPCAFLLIKKVRLEVADRINGTIFFSKLLKTDYILQC